MVQALMKRNSELQALRQYLGGTDSLMSQVPNSNQQAEVTTLAPALGEKTDQGSMQIPSRDGSTSLTAKEDASIPRSTLGDLDTVAGLEKELSNAKVELELMAKKERKSQGSFLLLLMLEGLVDERSRLNEALQAERQLYSSLVKFHAHPESSERDRTLQVELEGAQVLRSRLEEVLGRSLERLNRLETLAAIGGGELESVQAQENLHWNAFIHQALESKRKAQIQLKERKKEIMEEGFTKISHIPPHTMLSLCLENAELKEQKEEAMSDGWEIKEDKEKGEVMVETVITKEGLSESSLQAEFRKLQGKLKNAHNIINLLKEQLVLSSKEGNSKLTPELLVHLTSTINRINTELVGSPGKHQHQEEGNVNVKPCPRPQRLDLGATFTVDAHQLDNQSQPRDPGPQSAFSLLGSTQHLHSQLSQCKQRYQDLQEKLLLSEATVFAQANELEKYRVILSESLVKQFSKQVQVDLLDLGYGTCGRSKNEAEQEETTIPKCEEHNSLKEMVLMEGLCSEQGRRGSTLAGSSKRKPLENQLGKQEEFWVYGKSENISLLGKDIKDLKAQLQNANKVIQNLKSRVRSLLSVTSDYSSSLEKPRKLRAVGTLEGSSPHSVPDEDEGWLSDGTGAFYSPGLHAKKDLESLIQRVSQLEAQLPINGLEGKLAEELRSASWPGIYDPLIQAQAEELTHLLQKIQEGRGVCYLFTQHVKNTVKSFEGLLRNTGIAYYQRQRFCEQMVQGSQLTEVLVRKLATGKLATGSEDP
ncbi:PREDICTED: LOW QUALITY PROTEIN: myomegalin-like [Cercocebus atys]|uniref:LOW QUALITY PROTEIN: myomegalin-like n=1 Tax=Cercocebus atys TaxID=9531 RepID=UPI0005F53A34|nr:PREDICTED: LOW QUALITY PROTEIN: myomegalin-like [Cercocebus atys]